jgi:hypothetical protein
MVITLEGMVGIFPILTPEGNRIRWNNSAFNCRIIRPISR